MGYSTTLVIVFVLLLLISMELKWCTEKRRITLMENSLQSYKLNHFYVEMPFYHA